MCTTPFGSAVVPDVQSTSAGASTSTATSERHASSTPAAVSSPLRITISSPSKPAHVHQRDVVDVAERSRDRGDACAGLVEDEADLAGAERRCDRARDRAAPPDRPAERDGFPPVRQLPRDDVARCARRAARAGAAYAPATRSRSPIVMRRSPSTSATCSGRPRRSGRAASRRSRRPTRATAPAARAARCARFAPQCAATARRRPARAAAPWRAARARRRRRPPDPSARPGRPADRAASRRRPRSMPPSTSKTRPVTSRDSVLPSHTTSGETLPGSFGSKPSSGAAMRSANTSSVMRVRAAGAIALAVTP